MKKKPNITGKSRIIVQPRLQTRPTVSPLMAANPSAKLRLTQEET